MPSYTLKSIFWWCVLALIVRVPLGSHSTRSASAPGAMAPLRGKMLKILAALVEVTATNSDGVSRPVPTPWCHSTDMRSSTPPVPLGILRKSSLPMAFCGVQKQQWSVAVVWMWPACRPCHSSFWCSLGRKGGDITWCAAKPQSGLRYTESSITRCCASTSANTRWPSPRARFTASSASSVDVCTRYSGTPSTSAMRMALLAASPSTSGGRDIGCPSGPVNPASNTCFCS
mmetsp:Transcript_10612/g.26008  ORF Transcript_10612/g.26008 Transcript_10612/m.26008 type:complete len:230 (+) Transcript_10612:473-1162(+)